MLKWAYSVVLSLFFSLGGGLYVGNLVVEDRKYEFAHNQHRLEEKKPERASNFDYSRPRYLEIRTKVSNGYRFDIIVEKPTEFSTQTGTHLTIALPGESRPYYDMQLGTNHSTFVEDELLSDDDGGLMYAPPLR